MINGAANFFARIIKSKNAPRIKLLGDSITHGVGGTGFVQNGEPIVQGFARNPNGYCWANLFRDYMKERYNCTVVNNACTGTNIEFVIENFDELVDQTDDITICTIGTNNRHQYIIDGPKVPKEDYLNTFYNNIILLNGLFEKAEKAVIFIANIPASAANEEDDKEQYWRILHMNDINDAYEKASLACKFPFISLYNLFQRYCEDKKITVDSLLADGLHPNDAGYEVIFKLLIKELGV